MGSRTLMSQNSCLSRSGCMSQSYPVTIVSIVLSALCFFASDAESDRNDYSSKFIKNIV